MTEEHARHKERLFSSPSVENENLQPCMLFLSRKPQKCVCSRRIVFRGKCLLEEPRDWLTISVMKIYFKLQNALERKRSSKNRDGGRRKAPLSGWVWQITHRHTHTLRHTHTHRGVWWVLSDFDTWKQNLHMFLSRVCVCVCAGARVLCNGGRAAAPLRHSKSLYLTPISHSASLWNTQNSTNKQISKHSELLSQELLIES